MALMPAHHDSSEDEEPQPQKQPVKPEITVKTEANETNETLTKISVSQGFKNYSPPDFTVESSLFSMSSESQSMIITNSNTKNIVKNYGKAMCSFAASNLSLMYVLPLAEKEKIKIDRFKEYFRCKKELVGSIETFRNLYIEDNTDNPEIKAFKRVFKEVSIIFVKFFSVNWIFGGKLTQKQAHLKYRFKMLRRIRNPELFTYLKG